MRPLLAAAVALVVGVAACGGDDDPAPAAAPAKRVDRFDETRAYTLLQRQVTIFGPRPAGSDASRRLGADLRKRLPGGRFEAVPGGLRNVVGRLPGRRPAIVIGAHYDTEATVPGHVGANDGAAGTAAVVELARALGRDHDRRRHRELRFVLFDGEEEPAGTREEDFLQVGLRGSKAYVRAHRRQVKEMILLDYIAEARGLSFPMEGSSDPALWAQLRAAARRAGTIRSFPARTAGAVYDDHTPFLQAGIPAIDLIDFDYPQADTPQDDLSAVSARSLDVAGETVLELIRSRR